MWASSALSLKGWRLDLQIGALYVVLGAMCAAVNVVMRKSLVARYTGLQLAIYVAIAGALPFLFYLPWGAPKLGAMSHEAWWMLAYLGVVPIAFGYVMTTIALRYMTAAASSQMLLCIPPVAALIAWGVARRAALDHAVVGRRPGARGCVPERV